MSALPKKRLTPAEYLAIERAAPYRSEYFDGEMFAMAGARLPHITICGNIASLLNVRLKGTPCQALSIDMRVKVNETGLYTYPDVSVVCGEPELEDDVFDTLLNPAVIIEVLSPSTELYDRVTKFEHYRTIQTLKEYILVTQNRCRVERYVRSDRGDWIFTEFTDLDGLFSLGSMPIEFPIRDIYENVTFPESLPPLRIATPPPV